ncbi:centrosome-associated protein CEP250-like isoform X2 [Larus michahellis]|uniref:centrosome-associated protein CEP250-like isoform X2 n=1 Tax=Larus michahellis TaxID=119627 RepID=UPI003D9BD02C
MAQELLQKEEQHTDTLKVREADHQGEINKLLQDVAIAEGQRLSWLSEKRLLSQRLERLQRAVARLDREKTELKQYSAELRRTLEEVERERRRLRRCCRGRALPDAGGSSLSESDQHKMLASQQVSLPQTQLAQDGK